ncbi:MAG: helix-turn-helix domain-containing protein [Chitinophagia bacterium]
MIAILLVNFTPLFLLAGPMLYFYVRGVLRDDFRFSKNDWLHFVPAIILLINIMPHLFSSFEYKLAFGDRVLLNPAEILKTNNLFLPSGFNFLIRPFIGLLYVIICIRLVFLKFKYENPEDKQSLLIYRWIILLIFNTLLVYVSFLVFTIFSFQTLDYRMAEVRGYYFLNVSLVGLVLFNTTLLFFPNILYGLPQLDFLLPNRLNPSDSEPESKKLVKSFEISVEKLQLLHDKIETFSLTKPYLNPDFSLSVMSASTDIPVHHLSYYFNEHLNVNFNTWKNDLKINFVIEQIEKGNNELLTLDALAKQAGFVSRTTFLNAFKQKVGSTPTEFLNSLQK